jgi:hypothetical protein
MILIHHRHLIHHKYDIDIIKGSSTGIFYTECHSRIPQLPLQQLLQQELETIVCF